MKASLSVLIPWSNRPQLGDVLAACSPEFAEHNAEVIVINCGGSSEQLSRQIVNSKMSQVRQLDIPTSSFNKALALNLGASLSRGSFLFVLDADTVLTRGFFSEAMSVIDHQSYITVGTLYESETQSPVESIPDKSGSFVASVSRTHQLDISFTDGSRISQMTFGQDLIAGTRRSISQILVAKENVVKIGGYNSEHQGWGWEDVDIQLRLRHCLSLHHIEMGAATHLSHNDSQRALFGKTRAQCSQRNMALSLLRYSKGDFSGTYLQDAALWRNKVSEIVVR